VVLERVALRFVGKGRIRVALTSLRMRARASGLLDYRPRLILSLSVNIVPQRSKRPPKPPPAAPCPEQVEANEHWDRFTNMVRQVVSVPKAEVVKAIERDRAEKAKRAK
jgi:hypothetical protein